MTVINAGTNRPTTQQRKVEDRSHPCSHLFREFGWLLAPTFFGLAITAARAMKLAPTIFWLAITAARAEGHRYRKLAHAYFAAWNTHNVDALRPLLGAHASLRDWNVEVTGSTAVLDANAAIFAAAPKIQIETVQVHVAEATQSAICEILVKVNNAKQDLSYFDDLSYSR